MLTPALLIYPEVVEANIRAAIRMLNGDANRWRPHIKTVKCPQVLQLLIENGVRAFKCATTLELRVCCESGAADVLFAMPVVAATAKRVREIADTFPATRVSVLVESPEQLPPDLDVFVDVNPGMNRTGIGQERADEIAQLARAASPRFRGLHCYNTDLSTTTYSRVLEIVQSIGVPVAEVITSGTPATPLALSFEGFQNAPFLHRVSPGTIVFNDLSSLQQLPGLGFAPAAVVVTTVISHPAPGIVTCDAGHKSVSADAGVPTCAVINRPDLTPLKPSEEHLPIQVAPGAPTPAIGEQLYLLPRHVCPTVNLFDEALVMNNGQEKGRWKIAARGHEIG